MSNMYAKMLARGVDMSWYKKPVVVQDDELAVLETKTCSPLSVYVLKQDGTLWTIRSGEPYKQVRDYRKEIAATVFICLCCKAQASTWDHIKHSDESAASSM